MTSYYEITIQRYARYGLIIDTNLYVLLLVGRTDIEKVGFEKRTRAYVIDDYILLENTISQFDQRYTTPNIITETSNLLGAGKRTTVQGINSTFASDITMLQEEYSSSIGCASAPGFYDFGVTDVAISLVAARNQILVLTDDLPLYSFLANVKLPVLNFNHLRDHGL